MQYNLDESQEKSLKTMCSDFGGPTSTEYVLDVLSRVCFALRPDLNLDTDPFNDTELAKEVAVCFAALDYAVLKSMVENNG